jgi:hypothetical protein
MKILNKTILAAVVASSTMLLQAQLWSQTLAPTFTLKAGPATELQAEENYVMQQPAAAYAVPFRPTMSANTYAAAKQAAAVNYSPLAVKRGALSPVPAAPPTTIFANFDGASDTDGLRPPDTHGAVGLKHFVETTNSHINMFNKGNFALAKSVSLATFFGYTAEIIFDPRVVYDSVWNRWIVTAEAFPESNTVQFYFIAISKTSNPTKGFFIYKVDVDFSNNNDFWDFPQLGMDQDAVIFTANIFDSSSVFKGADAFAVAKARLYNGLGFSVPVFTGLVGTLAPPIVLDQNANTFLIAAPTSGTTFTKYTMTNSSHPASTALVSSTVTVPSYSVPPAAHQSPATSDLLDTSDSRFVNASTQNGTDLWQTHTIGLSGFPAPKFYRINTSTNTVAQSSFYFLNGTSDDWNASITANAASDAFVTWTSTNSGSVNARVVFSGKRNADATIPAGGVVGFTSTTFYNPSSDNPERWGDYSAVTIDPSNTARAWLVNEKINSTSLWGSRIMEVGF